LGLLLHLHRRPVHAAYNGNFAACGMQVFLKKKKKNQTQEGEEEDD
jgi:hypothetical protein